MVLFSFWYFVVACQFCFCFVFVFVVVDCVMCVCLHVCVYVCIVCVGGREERTEVDGQPQQSCKTTGSQQEAHDGTRADPSPKRCTGRGPEGQARQGQGQDTHPPYPGCAGG